MIVVPKGPTEIGCPQSQVRHMQGDYTLSGVAFRQRKRRQKQGYPRSKYA